MIDVVGAWGVTSIGEGTRGSKAFQEGSGAGSFPVKANLRECGLERLLDVQCRVDPEGGRRGRLDD